jgi:hypothetical protein
LSTTQARTRRGLEYYTGTHTQSALYSMRKFASKNKGEEKLAFGILPAFRRAHQRIFPGIRRPFPRVRRRVELPTAGGSGGARAQRPRTPISARSLQSGRPLHRARGFLRRPSDPSLFGRNPATLKTGVVVRGVENAHPVRRAK